MKTLSTAFLLATSLLLTACGVGKDRVRFEGKLENINDAEFYIYSDEGGFEGVDTIRIQDGEFVYERKLLRPVLASLLYPNFTQSHVILEPGKVIKMKGDASRVGEARITGTEENELLTDFRTDQIGKSEANHFLAAEQFIRQHAETMAAVAVFKAYFATSRQKNVKLSMEMLQTLHKAQPQNYAVNYLWNFYQPIFMNGVGEELPEFSAETTEGKKVSQADYAGKKLLVVAVGFWTPDSRTFLRELKKKLDAAGNTFEVLLVSLDVDKGELRKQLQQIEVNYPVICDRQAFNSPLVGAFGLRYVPSAMVVNSQGKIVQRDVTEVDKLNLNI
ncbi:MAG: DUF4369 domain-containing protein [Alloprevotella sp.]